MIRDGESVDLSEAGVPFWRTVREGKMMRGLVLGAVLCVALGLPANGAEFDSDAKTASVRPLACHWVTADRTLRLLRSTAALVDKSSTKVFAPNASRAAMTVHFERQLSRRTSLMVGVAY
jgi:hypothetical protein